MTESERAELDELKSHVAKLQEIVVAYLLKERETAIITMSHVEDALNMPRTKEKRERK